MTIAYMEPDAVLLRYGELFLKDKNRVVFEHKLVENIRKLITKAGIANLNIVKSQGRIFMPYFPEHAVLRRVFGVVSHSPAVRVEKNTGKIQQKAVELLQGRKGTFKVVTRRSDKTFPITSPEFNRKIGEYIEKNTSLEFSSASPGVILEIEINQEGAYLFFEIVACGGGLPTGVEGKSLLLVDNEASLLAGLLFMKRGCSIIPIAFEKTQADISLLQAFSPVDLRLNLVGNLKGLESLAAAQKVSILVTGQALNDKVNLKTNLTVMKPLIAYSEEQIREQLNKYKSLV